MLAATESDAAAVRTSSATLADRSGGNPLFLQELLAAARAAGGVEGLPDSVEGIVTAQIDRLPPPTGACCGYASVLGTSFDATTDGGGRWKASEIRSIRPRGERLGEFVDARTSRDVHRFRHALDA